jgi:hypothetical protein
MSAEHEDLNEPIAEPEQYMKYEVCELVQVLRTFCWMVEEKRDKN